VLEKGGVWINRGLELLEWIWYHDILLEHTPEQPWQWPHPSRSSCKQSQLEFFPCKHCCVQCSWGLMGWPDHHCPPGRVGENWCIM